MASKPERDPRPISGNTPTDDLELARFEGRIIRTQDFCAWFFRERRREALASLSRMVNEELLVRELQREGIALSPQYGAEVARSVREELEKDAALTYGIGTTVDRYTRLRFGETEAEHIARRVAAEERRELFGRVIRWRALQEGRVHLRVIHLRREEDARKVAADLDQGADFGMLADRHSAHESGREGGRLAPAAPSSLHPAIAARVGRMREGETSGVLFVQRADEPPSWQIVRLDRREPPVRGRYADFAGEIERDLAARPIDVIEWTAWSLTMETLYSVQLAGSLERP